MGSEMTGGEATEMVDSVRTVSCSAHGKLPPRLSMILSGLKF